MNVGEEDLEPLKSQKMTKVERLGKFGRRHLDLMSGGIPKGSVLMCCLDKFNFTIGKNVTFSPVKSGEKHSVSKLHF